MTDNTLDTRLDRLELRQEALISGVAKMNETLETQTEALAKLFEAATRPAPGSDLGAVLRQLQEALAAQTEALQTIERRLAALPQEIGAVFA